MAGDLYWDNVGLALHLDDVGLADIKGNAMTLEGSVARSSTESVFGGYSAYFDGASELLNTTGLVPDISTGAFSASFWVNPSTQTQTVPTVFAAQDIAVEYKTDGYPNGFVLNVNGARTAIGYHAEDTWYYISVVKSAPTVEIWLDGALAYTDTSAVDGSFSTLARLGGIFIGTSPETGFVGYVDDWLVTPAIARTDHSVPTSAFPEFMPDPVGVGSGAILVEGTGAGTAPPSGYGSGLIRLEGVGVGLVHTIGRGSGRVRVRGSGVGTVGRVMAGSGAIRVAGVGVGSTGRFGVGSGVIRVKGSGVARRGVSCVGSGPIRVVGAGVGSSTAFPVGVGSGAIHVYGRGVAGVPLEEFCA